MLSPNDTFYFRNFLLSPEHVSKINMVFFEEAYHTSVIIFKPANSARRALEYYLSFDVDHRGFKMLRKLGSDLILVCLKMLEEAVKKLGGNTAAIYKFEDNLWEDKSKKHHEDKAIDLVRNDSNALGTYRMLSKSWLTTNERVFAELKRQKSSARSQRFRAS
jgi:hypothetical protein